MCLLALAWGQHRRYRLVLVANRDEFHGRPTARADWWADQPDVLGGRDLEAGGTWLAVHRAGRLALVTNYRENLEKSEFPNSRGSLVSDFVRGATDPRRFAEELEPSAADYAGFNLLVSDGRNLIYLCNRGEYRRDLAPGIHALSNGRLDTPWPKVQRTRDRFAGAIAPERLDGEVLLSVVADSTPFPDNELPDTGLSRHRERLLSAPFVISPDYGTRCSTSVLWDEDDRISFYERSFDPAGQVTGNRQFEFAIESEREA